MSRLSIPQGTLPNAVALGAIAAADDVTAVSVTGTRLPFTPASRRPPEPLPLPLL